MNIHSHLCDAMLLMLTGSDLLQRGLGVAAEAQRRGMRPIHQTPPQRVVATYKICNVRQYEAKLVQKHI